MTSPLYTSDPAWGPLGCLLGHWLGEGDGTPGQGSGWFAFTPDLQGQILVRKNHAEYPATADRPAQVHDDLMIVYRDAGAPTFRAIYFDNEGHVIHYEVVVVDTPPAIEFVCANTPAQPGYRLTYTPTGPDTVLLAFAVAPPGSEPVFATYIEAQARRG